MLKWVVRLVLVVAAAAALVAAGGAASSVSRLPDLQPWHTLSPRFEMRAGDLAPDATLDEYLTREDALFRDVEERIEAPASASGSRDIPNRYVASSRGHWSRLGTNWNRTQVFTVAEPRGGAVLIHGLTDSPYSMRSIADRLHQRGFYTVSLRMQGHGTVPAGLVSVDWEDWIAAVRMAVRHVRQRIGADQPLVLVGYSNGGALVTKYALDAIEDPSLPAPAHLILISPMIGVSPLARLARTISLLGPVVEKARWLDVFPEYNPFKYNSFPANAGMQTYRLTTALRAQMSRVGESAQMSRLPPILTFQSVVDTTVSTPAVIYDLYDRLPAGRGHELVLFDLNRQTGIDAMTRPGAVLPRLLGDGPRPYAVTLVTNTSPDGPEVSAVSAPPAARDLVREPLSYAWPADMFSLSHVALPFPPDDPIYGAFPPPGVETVRLGRLTPRGEKDVLVVSLESLMRVSWNPFFGYVLDRVDSAVGGPSPGYNSR